MALRAPVRTSDAVGDGGIGDREWQAFRTLVLDSTGISLGDGKRVMLASRLQRRMRALSLSSFAEYHEFLCSPRATAAERQAFINCVTTNKTDFYREPHHFELLSVWARGNDADVATARARGLRIWSAACSSGEEPYTIAHTLRRVLPEDAWLRTRLLATDIDTEVLEKARTGRYADDRVAGLQSGQRSGLVERVPAVAGVWQIEPELRRAIRFERLNFLDANWPVAGGLDVLFCRNALIYFDSVQQRCIIERFMDLIAPHGLLFLGHAENLHWLTHHLEAVGHTAYRLRRARPSSAGSAKPADPASAQAAAVASDASARTRQGTHDVDRVQRTTTARRLKSAAPRFGESRRVEIGDVVVGHGEEWASAILGSCVAVCLVDPTSRVGGINHVLLPGDDASVGTRYGTRSYEELLEAVTAAGGRPGRLQAKLVGGAVASRMGASSRKVAESNLAQARAWLVAQGIPLVAERASGAAGVELHFQFGTGVLLVRPLSAPLTSSSAALPGAASC